MLPASTSLPTLSTRPPSTLSRFGLASSATLAAATTPLPPSLRAAFVRAADAAQAGSPAVAAANLAPVVAAAPRSPALRLAAANTALAAGALDAAIEHLEADVVLRRGAWRDDLVDNADSAQKIVFGR